MIPVERSNATFFTDYTRKVFEALEGIGFTVVSFTTDNHSINRNSFNKFVEPGTTYRISYNSDTKTYFLFDGVHLIKSIRNNWLNNKGVFNFPPFEGYIDGQCASFNHLRKLHELEKHSILEFAIFVKKIFFVNSEFS